MTPPEAPRQPAGRRPRGLRRPSGNLWVAVLVPLIGYVGQLFLSGMAGDTWFGTIPPIAVALVSLPAYVALVWRRDHVHGAVAVAWLQVLLLATLMPGFQPYASVLISLFSLALYLPLRQAVIGGLLWLIPIGCVVTLAPLRWETPEVIVPMAVFWVASAAIAFALGRSQRRSLEVNDLKLRTSEVEHALHIQDERLDVARELHDRVASSIAAVVVGLDGLERNRDELPAPAQEMLGLTGTSAHLAMTEIRHVLEVLRSCSPENGIDEDLAPAKLNDLLEQLKSSGLAGVPVTVTLHGSQGDVDPGIEHCAALCIREAATNAAKYGASSVQIEIDWRDEGLVAQVRNTNGQPRDNGPSMRGGMGLGGIIERAATCGGRVRLEADPHTFTVALQLPRVVAPDAN